MSSVNSMDMTVKWFQSPRTGKFESNLSKFHSKGLVEICFNPLERGNSNQITRVKFIFRRRYKVSIPQNGEIRIKFEKRSNNFLVKTNATVSIPQNGEIRIKSSLSQASALVAAADCFNPLERGNSNQILPQLVSRIL